MAKNRGKAAASGGVLPLSARPFDLLISLYYIIFLFTVSFTDLHNFVASVNGLKVTDLEHANLAYPPKVLTDLYFRWARSVDPLLYENPMWWQAIEWVNLCILTPYALVAIIAFPAGWNWIRNYSFIVSSFTFYSLVVICAETLLGTNTTANPSIFLGVYFPYAAFPLLIMLRMWRESSFSHHLSGLESSFLWLTGTTTLAIFFSYCLKWFVVYGADLLPPGIGEALAPHLAALP